MKNIKAIKRILSETVGGMGGLSVFSRRVLTAGMAAMLAAQMSGCALLILTKLSLSTYSAQTVYAVTKLAEGLYNGGFRFIVLGFGSALLADIVFKSYGSR